MRIYYLSYGIEWIETNLNYRYQVQNHDLLVLDESFQYDAQIFIIFN